MTKKGISILFLLFMFPALNAFAASGKSPIAFSGQNRAAADVAVNRGLDLIDEGKIDAAIAAFNEAVRIDPAYFLTFNNRGRAYYMKRDYDRAIIDYTKAVELKSDYDEAYYYRGNAYSLKGNYDQAIADYKKTLDISPNFQDAKSRLEDALKKKK